MNAVTPEMKPVVTSADESLVSEQSDIYPDLMCEDSAVKPASENSGKLPPPLPKQPNFMDTINTLSWFSMAISACVIGIIYEVASGRRLAFALSTGQVILFFGGAVLSPLILRFLFEDSLEIKKVFDRVKLPFTKIGQIVIFNILSPLLATIILGVGLIYVGTKPSTEEISATLNGRWDTSFTDPEGNHWDIDIVFTLFRKEVSLIGDVKVPEGRVPVSISGTFRIKNEMIEIVTVAGSFKMKIVSLRQKKFEFYLEDDPKKVVYTATR